ncbi:hypothetical protein NPIL_299311 [Nephila pilipes]|uniref:Uncharacterized protein n=1 Tax=Nephila pilipes TaxID=299642 RepID=A0A8X6T2T1_NEPPI|nr:hypothetical protein NPIL_299311 [Nephila pilipes]
MVEGRGVETSTPSKDIVRNNEKCCALKIIGLESPRLKLSEVTRKAVVWKEPNSTGSFLGIIDNGPHVNCGMLADDKDDT